MFYSKSIKGLMLVLTCLLIGGVVVAAPLRVITITEDFASIAKTIGGDYVEVSSLVKGSRNLHNISPKPSMVMAVKKADLLIRLGLSQDTWIDSLIQVARNSKVFFGEPGYLDCSRDIKKLEIPTGAIDGRRGDVHKFGNSHYWLSPENGKVIAKQIKNSLINLDPLNEAVYSKNYDDFSVLIDQKLSEWNVQMVAIQPYKIVTYHKVWPYFFESFGLLSSGELEPLPGIPPTTSHLIHLKKSLNETDTPTLVLMANYYPEHVGKSFAEKVGAKYIQVPCNVGSNGITSYIELFDYIIKEITQ
jgi:zinc/manganese transport system substrate-binding protein